MYSRKKWIIYIVLIFVVIILFIPLIYQRVNSIDKISTLLPRAEKIIIYNNKNITIDEKNKNFHEILRLTSERLKPTQESKKIINSSNEDSLLKEVSMSKHAWRCIEFIYDKPTSFKFHLNTYEEKEIKFKKVFFLVSAETPQDFGTNMIYGEEEYTSEIKNINTDSKIMTRLLKIIEQEVPYR